jgi:hypothetical protein
VLCYVKHHYITWSVLVAVIIAFGVNSTSAVLNMFLEYMILMVSWL